MPEPVQNAGMSRARAQTSRDANAAHDDAPRELSATEHRFLDVRLHRLVAEPYAHQRAIERLAGDACRDSRP